MSNDYEKYRTVGPLIYGGLAELVYCTGLENPRPVKGSVGSNPTASALIIIL